MGPLEPDREPFASPADLATELEGEFDDEQLTRWLSRAVRLLNRRIPRERDEAHLKELEILVGGHFAYPSVTGAARGRRLSRIEQESSAISFESMANIPGEYTSPFWDQAVKIDPRLRREPGGGGWTVSVG